MTHAVIRGLEAGLERLIDHETSFRVAMNLHRPPGDMIVKEIVERASSSQPVPPAPPRASSKGFPLAKHRSTGGIPEPGTRFQLRLDDDARSEAGQVAGGSSGSTADARPSQPESADTTSLQSQIDAENNARIAAMSEEERKQEAQELVERFGPGLVGLMQRRRAERQALNVIGTTPGQAAVTDRNLPASSLADHEHDSKVKGQSDTPSLEDQLPDVPIEKHKLAWMEPAPPSDDPSIRFDLSGNVLTPEQRESLPTSHGLHHHGASPDLAGYSLDDILVLCRSSLPGQRIKMLNLLGEIIRRHTRDDDTHHILQVNKVLDQAAALASEILACLPRAVGLHVAAIDLLYRCVVSDDASMDATQIRASSVNTPPVDWEQLLPGIQLLLCGDTGLPLGSIDRLIRLLQWASLSSQDTADAIFPLLPRMMRTVVLNKPWPMTPDDPPAITILRLANDLIRSSRGCATAFMDAHLSEPLLRYLVPSTWPASTPPDITIEAMQIFTSLARYGMNAELLSASFEIIQDLGLAVRGAQSTGTKAYLALLAAWMTCAIDPHRTTPEHSLTWTQIAGMGWAEEALHVLADSNLVDGSLDMAEAALNLLIAWLVGVEINTSDKGAIEKAQICHQLAGEDLNRLLESSLDRLTERTEQDLLAALIELDLITSSTGSDGILQLQQRRTLISLLSDGQKNIEARLRYHLTNLEAKHVAAQGDRASRMLKLFLEFSPSEEHLALSLLDALLKYNSSPSASSSSIDLQILRPLLQYTILPSAESIVGPLPPVHPYLKATTTLLRPRSPIGSGLPLASDWLFSPLNELLRSASSPALQQAPPDWNPSETEIVRATLILVQHQITAVPDALTRSEILFNLMKVFMLENEQASNTSDGEVFRDPMVSETISNLLKPTTTRLTPSSSTPNQEAVNVQEDSLAPLEQAARSFLGNDTPFFQFYTDFVALFEAISYSDTSFAQLLLPSLSMNYPVDYRRLVWIDHPQLATLVHLKIAQVPLESGWFAGYLEPKETDGDVLNGYAQAFTRGWITKDGNEFMWTVTMSHLLHAVWSEDEAGKRLLRSIVNSGSKGTIKDLLSLSIDSTLNCVHVTDDVLRRRLDRIGEIFSPEVRAKVEILL